MKDAYDLFIELGIILEHDVGYYKGKNVRYTEYINRFDVGDDDFDRWSNSLDFSFDLYSEKGQSDFILWANQLQQDEII